MSLKKFFSAWDEILVYLATLLGVILAQVLPPFKAGAPIDPDVFKHGRLFVALLVAFYCVLQEESRVTPGTDPELARAGKRRNLKSRLSTAITHGVTWTTFIS